MRTTRWPISHLPISDITPFTYRDGETYLELLNRLSKYITEQLHPNLRNTVEHIVEEMEHIIAAQHNKYVEGIQDFQRIHDAFMTDVNSALMALNDGAVSDLVGDPGSQLGQTLRDVFATDQDFQDFKKHTQETTQIASATDTNIYVSTTGYDVNNGVTQQTPVRTLQRAVELIPDVIHRGHVFTVNIEMGTWNESLIVNDRTVQGQLIFRGTTTNRELHRVKNVFVSDCSGHITFQRLWTTRSDQSDPKFEFLRSGPFMEVLECGNEVVDDDTNDGIGTTRVHGLLADYGSKVSVRDSNFSGNRYGIRSNWFSHILVRDCEGHGNTMGVGARFGGITSIQGSFPKGLLHDTTASSGGVIVESTGASLGHDRYNEDYPLESLTLMDYDLIQSGSRARVSKRWQMRTGNEFGGPNLYIASGESLRLAFDLGTTVTTSYLVDVRFMYQSGAVPQFIDATVGATIRTNRLSASPVQSKAHALGSDHTPTQAVALEHSGSQGRFYLDLTPNPSAGGVGNGWYSVEVEITSMRPDHAPSYFSASVV